MSFLQFLNASIKSGLVIMVAQSWFTVSNLTIGRVFPIPKKGVYILLYAIAMTFIVYIINEKILYPKQKKITK